MAPVAQGNDFVVLQKNVLEEGIGVSDQDEQQEVTVV